ncbi:MAG: hypothetical protein A2161_09415, partial [Candidatus Schekmanbacteria bacterium RBG_13_48_7]
GLISTNQFTQRSELILETLSQIQVCNNELPNIVYNTRNAEMVNYANQPVQSGIGWNGIDVGRLLIWLRIWEIKFPCFADKIQHIVHRWNMNRVVLNNELHSIQNLDNQEGYYQVGRLGFEQYAARGFALWGYDVKKALSFDDKISYIDIEGIKIPFDKRDLSNSGASNYVLSDSYILEGLETGWSSLSTMHAYAVYMAQERFFQRTKKPRIVSTAHLIGKPWFTYNSMYANGHTWVCIGTDGEFYPQTPTVNTAMVFGWHYLYGTDFTSSMLEKVKSLFDKEKGWFEGFFENNGSTNLSITCATNGLILESLLFHKQGKFLTELNN